MFIEPLTLNQQFQMAKFVFLQTSKGLGGDPNMLASTFTFEEPVVGPLAKDAFVSFGRFCHFDTAFPNWTPQF